MTFSFITLRISATCQILLCLLVTACASFDKTNIKPEQRVYGPGVSFTVPTEKSWFAVEYGTSHRIKLSQLNDDERYSILMTINRGPISGMYPTVEAHLHALKLHKALEYIPPGFYRTHHEEWIDPNYGNLCVRHQSSGKDWRGRNKKGYALIDTIGLNCAHPVMQNVLVSIEISRRYERHSPPAELIRYADELFSSLDYFEFE